MTISTVLEVAIGLMLIYYALGLIVNLAVGVIKNLLDMRAEALEPVVKLLLQTDEDWLFHQFMDRPLMRNLIPITSKAFQLVNRQDGQRKSSEIPPGTFSLALLDTLATPELVAKGVRRAIERLAAELPDGSAAIMVPLQELEAADLAKGLSAAVDEMAAGPLQDRLTELRDLLVGRPEQQLDLIRAGVQGLPASGVKSALLSMIDFNINDVKEVRGRLESWYDDMMKNVTLLFTKTVRKWVIAVSLLITLIVGADSITIAQALWEQPARRAAVAAAVPAMLTEFGKGEALVDDLNSLTPEERLGEIQKRILDVNVILGRIEALDLPITWSQAGLPGDFSGWVLKIVGLLITGIATAQGSSFWYDILRKVNPKSSTPSKES